MSIAAGIASLNACLNTLKALREIEKAYDQAALKMQIADLMSNVANAKMELVGAQEQMAEKDAEIARLAAAIEKSSQLIEGPGGYSWADRGDGVKIGYPLCPACLPKGHQVQLLQKGSAFAARCPTCAHEAMPVECFLEPAADGSQQTVRDKRKADSQAQFARDTAAIRNRSSYF